MDTEFERAYYTHRCVRIWGVGCSSPRDISTKSVRVYIYVVRIFLLHARYRRCSKKMLQQQSRLTFGHRLKKPWEFKESDAPCKHFFFTYMLSTLSCLVHDYDDANTTLAHTHSRLCKRKHAHYTPNGYTIHCFEVILRSLLMYSARSPSALVRQPAILHPPPFTNIPYVYHTTVSSSSTLATTKLLAC